MSAALKVLHYLRLGGTADGARDLMQALGLNETESSPPDAARAALQELVDGWDAQNLDDASFFAARALLAPDAARAPTDLLAALEALEKEGRTMHALNLHATGNFIVALSQARAAIESARARDAARVVPEPRWPFAETIEAFTERLSLALGFDGDLAAAVRKVLVENPPALADQQYQRGYAACKADAARVCETEGGCPEDIAYLIGFLPEGPPRCQVPPTGWICTREAGHLGPCAAVPKLTIMHCQNCIPVAGGGYRCDPAACKEENPPLTPR